MLMNKLSAFKAFTAVATSKFRNAQGAIGTNGMNIPKEVLGDELQEWQGHSSP